MLDILRQYWPDLLKGAGITVLLTVTSMAVALVLGLVLALLRTAPSRLVRLGVTMYVDFFRGTPLLLQLFYLYFVLPYAGIRLPPLTAAIIGLGFNYAAYLSEVYRAAIDAVDGGQREAAYALGMSDLVSLRRIVLPQAFRIALPPIGNYFIAMFKDTALVAVISVRDLLFTAEDLANQTYRYLPIFTIVLIIYFAISYPASLGVKRLEKRLQRRVRVDEHTSSRPHDLVRAHA